MVKSRREKRGTDKINAAREHKHVKTENPSHPSTEWPQSARNRHFLRKSTAKFSPTASKMLVLRVSGTSGVSYHQLRGVNLTNALPSRKHLVAVT